VDCLNSEFIFVNFHQDFVAITLSDFFQGETGRDLFHWPNHSWDTGLSNQKEEEEEVSK
jgi:hypothetical protein